ncbi:hypothetical protein HYDPIDRAFT_108344 [Hydnomerulius pinastri MD-312]|nr:hypothetical protein HYDPIDRAFT_108344 [Hydnomerulius pinastri MD-312]
MAWHPERRERCRSTYGAPIALWAATRKRCHAGGVIAPRKFSAGTWGVMLFPSTFVRAVRSVASATRNSPGGILPLHISRGVLCDPVPVIWPQPRKREGF